jgi:type I restriction-modification system DNA methylase subunit
MVQVVDPRIGETVYDPCCGTGGFLAQAFEHMLGEGNENIRGPEDLETLKTRTFYGREKENLIYPIALANLVLHGIDEPHLWHGNALTGQEIYGGLFQGAPALFDVECIVSLPAGVFTAAGAGVKTNLLFFTKGRQTERVWYYDLSDVKVTKKKPLTREHLEDFFRLLPKRADSERSWLVTQEELERRGFDLKAVNPNAKIQTDTRTPDEILDLIEEKGREIKEALALLRS